MGDQLRGLAKSTDSGQTWTKLDAPRWGGESNFVQVSVANLDGELYFWGVTHGRFGGVAADEGAAAEVEDQDAYRYFTGTAATAQPTWSADDAAAATRSSTTPSASCRWSGTPI